MVNVVKPVAVKVSQSARIFFNDIFGNEFKKSLKSFILWEVKFLNTDLVISFNHKTVQVFVNFLSLGVHLLVVILCVRVEILHYDLSFMNESKFCQENCVFLEIIGQKHFLVRSNQLNDLILIRNFKVLLNFLSKIRECLILIQYDFFLVAIQKNVHLKWQLLFPNIGFITQVLFIGN